ncbi:ABC transporter [Actinomadura vinacea]|uniref:ABC transporter n=1 Tax=Actinomadura vinacea TaxID=115336 RepID=A0ABN3JCN9_9ACTN
MTVLERPVEAAPETGAPVRAMMALARIEARRLLLHPLVVLAVVGYMVLLLWPGGGSESYPVLHEVDRESQLGPLLIGLAGLLAVNAAVLRSRRHGTETHFGVLLLPPWWRTAAHALSVVSLVLVASVIVAGGFALEAARAGAVGQASFAELATGPLIVLFLGAVGVLLARLVPSVLVGPLAVVVVLALTFVFVGRGGPWRWLAPLVADEGVRPLPSDLLGRAAGWHALYLVAAAALAALAAVWAAGARRAALHVAAAGALAGTVAAGVMQGAGPSDELVAARERATREPAAVQDCTRHGLTTYCAFGDFKPWIGEWRKVADGVRALAGPAAATRPLTVRQRVNALKGPSGMDEPPPAPGGEVTVGTAWDGERRLELSASVARGFVVGSESHDGVFCDARGILTFWLAIKGIPDGEARYREVQSQMGGGGGTIWAPVNLLSVRDREYAVVKALLARPDAEVAGRVKASWAELVRKGTTTDRAAALLGVTAPAETAADREWNCG